MSALINKKEIIRELPLAIVDTIATISAFLLSVWIVQPDTEIIRNIQAIAGFLLCSLINVFVFSLMHMYSILWKYASVTEGFNAIIFSLISTVIGDVAIEVLFALKLSIQTYLLEYIVFLFFILIIRFAIRIWSGEKGWKLFGTVSEGLPRTLIIGAGEAGSNVVKKMIALDRNVVGCPIGLVDDESAKIGSYIHGIKVLGTCKEIPEIAKKEKIEQLIIAIPSATNEQREYIYKKCLSTNIKTLTLSNIEEITKVGYSRAKVRKVNVSDLLEREEINLDTEKLDYVNGSTILVTGAGGSIGSELVRQLLNIKPHKIILFDIYENTTYELFHEIKSSAKRLNVELAIEVGSITSLPALNKCFKEHKPQVVFHAAAHKHVPLMENNPREAIENNVFGTFNLIQMSIENNCSHFILISTDKAVNPTNVMGATKRMCEMMVQCYSVESNTVFAAVRFGNVLGSHGSVIPLFERQIEQGGPITVTHREITRYFMTIPEATKLVITAGSLANGGEIFILNMGNPVKIWDLAEKLLSLSGLKAGDDIEIIETGLRPGEKLYEELLMEEDCPLKTSNSSINVSRAVPPTKEELIERLKILNDNLDNNNDEIKLALAKAVSTYKPYINKKNEVSDVN